MRGAFEADLTMRILEPAVGDVQTGLRKLCVRQPLVSRPASIYGAALPAFVADGDDDPRGVAADEESAIDPGINAHWAMRPAAARVAGTGVFEQGNRVSAGHAVGAKWDTHHLIARGRGAIP